MSCALPLAEPPVLQAARLAKRYGATTALVDARLSLRAGRVHALMGENGAGKSTLVRILVGAQRPDAGELRSEGRPVTIGSVRAARGLGIVPVHQHLTLFPTLSVRENLSAFELCGGHRLRAAPLMMDREQARGLLARVGLSIDLHARVAQLSLGERQLLEIARGLGQQCRVLVLDEPTAALSAAESRRLFGVVRELCSQGVAVLFISHKLDEIDALADDVTVMRDGRTVIDAADSRSLPRHELLAAMLGHLPHDHVHPARHATDVVMRAEGLKLRPQSAPSDLHVRAGEIVGLVGLAGSGVLDLGQALAGAWRIAGGTVRLLQRPLRAARRDQALVRGIGLVPADRHDEGLFDHLSATINATVCALGQFGRLGWLNLRRERMVAAAWLQRLGLQPLAPLHPASGFSGGNQQKLLIARSLMREDLRVLVALEPTRGVDVGARQRIHESLLEACARGIAIVVASSDLDEVCTLCERVYVVQSSAVIGECQQPTPERLSALMGAHA